MSAGRDEHQALAILPARIGSARLPRKVLLDQTGLPLFVHTARNVARAASIERVVVATDSEEVVAAATAAGIEGLMTSPTHPSGTDRVHEALGLVEGEWRVVVNVQADEPELDPRDLDELVASFADPEVEIATLACPILEAAELERSSVVKVVRDARGDALYFSRAPIPDRHHARAGAPETPPGLRHVGVYAFRPASLARFCALPVGTLEATESLEQLRWLEAGGRMRVLDARCAPPGIDTEDDYREFVARTNSDLERNRR